MNQKHFSFLAGLAALVCLSACACSPERSVQKVLGADTEAPVFLGYKALSRRAVAFLFSRPVSLVSLRLDPDAEVAEVQAGEELTVNFTRELPGGSMTTADFLVEDGEGNTLEVLVSFRNRNDRMPLLALNEIRTEYSKPRVEFVELKTASAGNLGALRLMIASQGLEKPVYEFPPVEVGADEYVVVHLRKPGAAHVDELGDELDLCPVDKDTPANARDLWVPGTAKLLKKTDAVFLMDQDGTVLDAVLFSETKDAWWANEKMVRAAELLAAHTAWFQADGGSGLLGPQDAVHSRGITATRTICRDETLPNSKRAADWYIAATSSSSAGTPNNPKRYVP